MAWEPTEGPDGPCPTLITSRESYTLQLGLGSSELESQQQWLGSTVGYSQDYRRSVLLEPQAQEFTYNIPDLGCSPSMRSWAARLASHHLMWETKEINTILGYQLLVAELSH